MPSERTDLGGGRGLGRYGDPIHDTHHDQTFGREGTTITVQDSSAAMYGACWIRLEGEAHLRSTVRPFAGFPYGIAEGDVSAHLNIEKAKQIIEALSAWVERIEGTVNSDWEEDHGQS